MAPGSVEYLLHGCDSHGDSAATQDRDPPAIGATPEGQTTPRRGASSTQGPASYLLAGVNAGEPDGVWLGRGMEGLGLSMRAGDTAEAGDVRALFGQLRYPTREMPGSTEKDPIYLGSKPRRFRTAAQLVEDALKKEQGPVTVERQQQIEQTAKKGPRRPTAYYDVTFSPVKSVSLMYTALLSAGDIEGANAIREAHNEAIRIAVASVEKDLAYVRTGRHEGHGPSGRTVGRWERATGLMVVVYAHHTNRDGEPQLHAHAAVSARAATPDERIYAIDGYGFHSIKDALATTYTRSYQQITTERLGFVYEQRSDGAAREIAGISPDLLVEGSSRTLNKVRPLVADLVEAYTERHGHEPGPRARRALVEQAVKDTRRPKTGPAGPGAIAAWVDGEGGRRERLAAALDAAERAAVAAVVDSEPPWPPGATTWVNGRDLAIAVLAHIEADTVGRTCHEVAPGEDARTGGVADVQALERTGFDHSHAAALAELVVVAVERGIADVQAKYATWNIGNLTRAIDEHLGDWAGALGVAAAERAAFLAAITEHVLVEPQRFGIVQVSAGDPVPVPDALRRTGAGEDGRPMFRAHIDERYATTAHLTAERRLLASIRTAGAVRARGEQLAVVQDQLAQLPLSADQAAAISGVLSSGRAADVIVGPAGTGKSHTMGVLAVEWNAVTGGRVHGVASAEIAARNLAGLGMEARNIHRFLADFLPDPATGLVRDRLERGDLIVVDEAGMTPTTDLVALTDLAGEAGAKVVFVGDHHQLQPVGAGGMFALLATQPEVFELAVVHRFAEEWEADASLLLRSGDPVAAIEYADRGRLVCGTMDEITAMAVRGHVADMLDGRSALLIVASNELAAQLSRQVHDELVSRGRVTAEPLVYLPDTTAIAVGDLIQTRLNASRLHVEPGPDGSAMPVTNKEVYAVAGRLDDGTLLVRDQRGAVAHLPAWYVREHVALAYAVTAHAAQGVTVDVGRGVLSLDATREQSYVPASRGRERNLLYLQTEHHPDTHEPQRVHETPVQRLTDILSRTGIDEAALSALETARADETSMATLGALYAGVSEQYAHCQNAQALTDILGPDRAAQVQRDSALGALLGAVYAAELDGHDPRTLLTEAVQMQDLAGARSIAQVLHWRVSIRVSYRETEGSQPDATGGPVEREWGALARVLPDGDPVRGYLLEVAALAQERQAELGALVAADPPEWARQRLPAVPDPTTGSAAREDWERRAGAVAAYREYRGIPDTQVSLGEPPPPAQQFARAMWLTAAEQLDEDPSAQRWLRASDAELQQAREAWQRTLHEAEDYGPRSVAEQMSSTYRLAAEIRDDAILTRADARALPAADPRRSDLLERADRYQELAVRYLADARALGRDHAARQEWWDRVAPMREADQAATAELQRRGIADLDSLREEGDREVREEYAGAENSSDTDGTEPEPSLHDTAGGARETGHQSGLDRTRFDEMGASWPESDQDRRAARDAADQRSAEAARRGQPAETPTPHPGYNTELDNGPTATRRDDLGVDRRWDGGMGSDTDDGYGWD